MKKHTAWMMSFLLAAGCVLPAGADETGSSMDSDAQKTWQDAYCDFVFNQDYLQDENAVYGDTLTGDYGRVSFALRDMNNDGTPELIVYNGDEVYAGSLSYVYQYTDGGIRQAGTMPGSNYNRFLCVDELGLPGIFCSGAHTGAYWTDYFSFDGTAVSSENVWTGNEMEYNPDTGETVWNTDPDTGDVIPKQTSRTDNETLYEAYLLIADDAGGVQLPFYTLDEIRQMGWADFLEKEQTKAAGFATDASVSPEEVLTLVPDEFYFSSGVGGWGTEMTLNDDGTFTGNYHDSNMGEDTENYPNGTVYVSTFEGSFTDFKKVDDYTWSMRLDSLDYEQPVGEDWAEDGIHYIASEAYGLAGGDQFYLYLPGHPVDTLPEEYLTWADMYMNFEKPQALTIYGIYNEKEGLGWGGMF